MRIRMLFMLIVIFLIDNVYGSELLSPQTFQYGARANGMAGSFTSVSDDYNLFFINPAGNGRESIGDRILRAFNFPNMSVGGSDYSINILSSYLEDSEGIDTKVKELIASVKEEDSAWARFRIFPYFTLWRFSLGVLMESEGRAFFIPTKKVEKSEIITSEYKDGDMEGEIRNKTEGFISISFPFKDTGILLGVQARPSITRVVFHRSETWEGEVRKEGDDLFKSSWENWGVAYDLGALYESNIAWVPSVGLSVFDLGNTYYKSTYKDSISEVRKARVDLGISWKPLLNSRNNFSLIIAANATHLNDDRVSWENKFSVGGEIKYGNFISNSPIAFQLGSNIEGLSVGVIIDLWFFKIGLSTFKDVLYYQEEKFSDQVFQGELSVDVRY